MIMKMMNSNLESLSKPVECLLEYDSKTSYLSNKHLFNHILWRVYMYILLTENVLECCLSFEH